MANIEGDNIGIQNNYPSSPSSKEDLIEIAAKINEIGKQLQDLLNLDPTNPDDRVAILTMGKKALERQPQLLDTSYSETRFAEYLHLSYSTLMHYRNAGHADISQGLGKNPTRTDDVSNQKPFKLCQSPVSNKIVHLN